MTTDELIAAVRDGRDRGETASVIAQFLGVKQHIVENIARRNGMCRERRYRTTEQEESIRAGYAAGTSTREIAALLGISKSAVCGIAARLNLTRHALSKWPFQEPIVDWKMPEPVALGCRWLHGDVKMKTATWCSDEAMTGSSYCQAHHKRCYSVQHQS